MLEKFIKRAFFSFYFDRNFHSLLEVKRNKKLILKETYEFKEKNDLEKKINEIVDEYPQNFISTVIDTINQGVIPSCSKKDFINKGIDIENIKIVCIKNYSFYVSIYELLSLQKEFKFDIDFIYSIFAPIDYTARKKHNSFYVLLLNSKVVSIGYQNNLPLYFDLEIINDEDNDEDDEFLDDIDILDDLSDDIEDESESLDLDEINKKNSKEDEIFEILQKMIKDYYENYSDEFLEKIVILDTINMEKSLKKKIEDELFIETDIKKFDLLKILNELSEKDV